MTTMTVGAHWGGPDLTQIPTLALTGSERIEPAVLTTEHAQSSYGLPVLLIGGQVYGPADLPGLIVTADRYPERPSDDEQALLRAAIRAGYRVSLPYGMEG